MAVGESTSVETLIYDRAGIRSVRNLSLPMVTGDAPVGYTLTTDGDVWNPQNVDRAYQWLRDGGEISGADTASYTVVAADRGSKLSVRVLASAPGLLDSAATSSETATVADPDTTAPDTTITSGPAEGTVVRESSVVFEFVGAPAGDTDRFECSVDGAAFSVCTSPATIAGLSNGDHSFAVRAIDVLGNTDATPATRTFGVDTRPVTPPTSASCIQAEADLAKAQGQVKSFAKKSKAAKKKQSKAKKVLKKVKKVKKAKNGSKAQKAKLAKKVKTAKKKMKKARVKVKRSTKGLKVAKAAQKNAQNKVNQNC